MTETRPSQLARRINDAREAVQAQTTKAERGHIRRRNLVVFLAALVDRDVYARALGTHYATFAQLEDSLNRHSGNETFKETRHVLDALRLTAAFERDLKVLYGSAWRSIIPRHQGATRMAERIRKHSEEDPPMLLVYALLLYETILSLRRAKKLLVISLKLGFQPPTSVLECGGMSQDSLGTAMDSMSLSREMTKRLLEESIVAEDMSHEIWDSIYQQIGLTTASKALKSPLVIALIALVFLFLVLVASIAVSFLPR